MFRALLSLHPGARSSIKVKKLFYCNFNKLCAFVGLNCNSSLNLGGLNGTKGGQPRFHSSFIHTYIQGVTGGTDQTSGECSLGQTIPI